MTRDAKLTVFAGHYGSGKTSLAVRYALRLSERRQKVMIADLDIVNPYFRTKDSAKMLETAGVRLISSKYANTNVDVPSIPAEANALFEDDVYGIVDLGGDDRGALAFGRYAERFAALGSDAEAFLVVNLYRPMSRDIASLVAIKEEIEKAARLRFTGIINNSNLGAETTAEDVMRTVASVNELAERTGLPVVMTAVKSTLVKPLEAHLDCLFPMDLEEYKWQ